MIFLLACTLGSVFAMYFLVLLAFAFLIKSTQKLTAAPPANSVPLDMLPPEVFKFCDGIIESLTSIGYKNRGVVRIHDPAAHITNWVIVFSNAESNDYALAAIVSSTQEGAEDIKTSFVEFSTKLTDGRTIDTNNITSLLPYPSAKSHKKTILPELNDLKQLHMVHQYVLTKSAKDATKICDVGESVAKFIVDELRKGYEQQAERGLYSYDPAAGVFVPTWFGSFVMAFMLMWPVTVLRNFLIKSSAKRVIAQSANALQSSR